MSQRREADRPVNRLLDIVVEEVSLVDRAANEHRFLIVKRDTPMADTQTDTVAADETGDLNEQADVEEHADAPEGAPTAGADPLLTHAVAALEGLTSTVESCSGRSAPTRPTPGSHRSRPSSRRPRRRCSRGLASRPPKRAPRPATQRTARTTGSPPSRRTSQQRGRPSRSSPT